MVYDWDFTSSPGTVDKHRDAMGVPYWDGDKELHKRRHISDRNGENSANFAILRLHEGKFECLK
jgi:hypothetical protein